MTIPELAMMAVFDDAPVTEPAQVKAESISLIEKAIEFIGVSSLDDWSEIVEIVGTSLTGIISRVKLLVAFRLPSVAVKVMVGVP